MKMKLTLLAATLAACAASSAFAADAQPADTRVTRAETPREEAKAPAKKHNHGAEKGTPRAKSKARRSHRETMNKDMPMHDHTQDRH